MCPCSYYQMLIYLSIFSGQRFAVPRFECSIHRIAARSPPLTMGHQTMIWTSYTSDTSSKDFFSVLSIRVKGVAQFSHVFN